MKEFKSQVCTTKEQSQRLLELGLKPETADMSYYKGEPCLDPYEEMESPYDNIVLPAWSLHRLKCLLSNKIPYGSGYLTVEIINNVNLMFITDTSEQRVISFIHENLYESMIKCIEWLIKENYFNKHYLSNESN
jgi:hypothetical protein